MAKIMFSGRFDGGMKENYLRQTAAELGGLGFEILVVEAGAGDSYGPQTMEYLYQADIVVAMVCDKYGELTKSPYCSHAEVKYFIDKKKRVIPIQLYNGEWPPEPEPSGAAQNHFFFTGDRVKVMAINKNGALMSAKALAEQISQAVRKMLAKEEMGDVSPQARARATVRLAWASPEEGLHLPEDRAPAAPLLCRASLEEGLCLPEDRRLAATPLGGASLRDGLPTPKDGRLAATPLGGASLRDGLLTPKDCRTLKQPEEEEDAWEEKERQAKAWFALGAQGGGKMGSDTYGEKECYEKALSMDRTLSRAWAGLSRLGGGTVKGKYYNKDECITKFDQAEKVAERARKRI